MTARFINSETPVKEVALKSDLRFLETREVSMIDEALGNLGEFGEVRLIIHKGRLRYLVTQRSFDALKWTPGKLA